MKNYLQHRNNEGDWLSFFDDPWGNFFKPIFNERAFDKMRTDVKETKDGFLMTIDMPGFNKEDINLSLEDGYLTVKAERKEKEEESDRYVRRERQMSIKRSYYVGENLAPEDIKAKYDNGVLELNVPKKEEKKIAARSIKID